MLDAIFIFEIVGTIAFAISGAVTACQKQMDLFGVAFLGITTAVGGGIIRDLILGINPPTTFRYPIYLIFAIAMSVTPGANYFLFSFVGIVTGVGGGVLRDVMAGDKPYIFIKHFYASASLIGAIVCVSSHIYFNNAISMSLGMITVIVLRLMAAHFRWSLPKSGVYLDNDKGYREDETEFN